VGKRLGQVLRAIEKSGLSWFENTDTPETAALYNTGKMPEPDRLRREAYEKGVALAAAKAKAKADGKAKAKAKVKK
jgi:hypothetical protein